MKITAQVKLNKITNDMLTELSVTRKKEGHVTSTKQGIVAELILSQYRKEILKGKVNQKA